MGHTHTHCLSWHFPSHFPGRPGLAHCCLDSQSPVILFLSIITEWTKSQNSLNLHSTSDCLLSTHINCLPKGFSRISFYRPDCLSCRPTNSVKALKVKGPVKQKQNVYVCYSCQCTTLNGAVLCRSVYFGTYAHCKSMYHDLIHPVTKAEQSVVHLCSAASAGKFLCNCSSWHCDWLLCDYFIIVCHIPQSVLLWPLPASWPMDIIFYWGMFLSSFFHRLSSEVSGSIITKLCHMFSDDCNL